MTCATGHDVLQFKLKAGHAALVAHGKCVTPGPGPHPTRIRHDASHALSENALMDLELGPATRGR